MQCCHTLYPRLPCVSALCDMWIYILQYSVVCKMFLYYFECKICPEASLDTLPSVVLGCSFTCNCVLTDFQTDYFKDMLLFSLRI